MSRVTYQEAETYISELPKFTKKNTPFFKTRCISRKGFSGSTKWCNESLVKTEGNPNMGV